MGIARKVAYAVGLGSAAALWGERFWSKKRFLLVIIGLYLSTLVLLPVMTRVRRWTRDDGETLLVTAVIVVACGALAAALQQRRRVQSLPTNASPPERWRRVRCPLRR